MQTGIIVLIIIGVMTFFQVAKLALDQKRRHRELLDTLRKQEPGKK